MSQLRRVKKMLEDRTSRGKRDDAEKLGKFKVLVIVTHRKAKIGFSKIKVNINALQREGIINYV